MSALHAVPLQQLTAATAGGPFLPLSGGTVSGPTTHTNQAAGPTLTLGGDATQITNANPTGWLSIGGFVGGTPSNTGQLVNLTIQDTMHSPVFQQGFNIVHNLAPNGNTASGNRVTLNVVQSTIGSSQGGSFNQVGINQAGQFTLFAQSNVGGTPTTPKGAQTALGVTSTLYGAATNFSGNGGIEIVIAQQAGSSVIDEHALLIVHTSDHQVQASREANALVVSDQPGAGARWKTGIAFGGSTSQWSIDTAGGALIQGCISNNYLTVPASARFGFDAMQVGFPAFTTIGRNGFLASNGFAVDGVGAVQIGTAYLTPSTTGVTIDVNGIVGTGTPTVAAGGTGYAVNDLLFNAWGGVYRVATVSAGAVATVSVYADSQGHARQPYYPARSAPANPVATTTWTVGTGSGCTLTLAWNTTASTLAIQPSGALTTFTGDALFQAPGSFNAIRLSGAGGDYRLMSFETAGSVRVRFGLDNAAEGGGNTGSNWVVATYDNTGAPLGNALSIARATGSVTFVHGISAWNATPPASKPTVSGAKGSNAALASLLTALAAYGLVTDSTTA